MDFKANKLFPFQFMLLGYVFFGVGLIATITKPLMALLLIPTGFLIITAYQGIEFDPSTSRYRKYNAFFYIKFGSWVEHVIPVKIFINASNVSQKVYTRVTTGSTYRNREFSAYLKFENDSKLLLGRDKKKDKLIEKLEPLAKYFQLSITDNTE